MYKLSFFFFFFYLISATIYAQNIVIPDTYSDTAAILKDQAEEDTAIYPGFAKQVLSDTTISFTEFSIKKDSISAIKLKKEYAWVSIIDSFLLAKQKESANQSRIIIRRNSGHSFLSGLLNSGALQIFMWILAAMLVLFVIYKLFLSEGIFKGRSVNKNINIQINNEEVSLDNDYESLLLKAYNDKQWRIASRFLFLKTLKILHQKSMIKFAGDKTNRAYFNELPIEIKTDFNLLTNYYEYVWYGNIEIDKTVFDAIENKYNNFLNKI